MMSACASDSNLLMQVLEFPVAMLVRFWANHHLLDVLQRPIWRVVTGRSRAYVDAILAGCCPWVCGSGSYDMRMVCPWV